MQHTRSKARCFRLLVAALANLAILPLAVPAAAGSAKILLYHHVDTTTPSSTSVTPERFAAHLDLIESTGYQVVPLTRIVAALLAGDPLDARWVAITFDDAYASLLTEAAPRLSARGWPFTVFVATADVDSGHRPYLDWDELLALRRQGALIANHSRDHEHMVRRPAGESEAAWRMRLTAEVMAAQRRLEATLGETPRLFAYPYGEFDSAATEVLGALDFVAFGQQSGPVGSTTNLLAIPRFPLATGFDSLESLAEKLATEQLPLAGPTVPATVLDASSGPPTLTLSLATADVHRGNLTCFANGVPTVQMRWQDDRVVEIRPDKPLNAGRSRITCTAPYPGRSGTYYWYTHLYMKPAPDGSWYDG